MKSFVLMTVFLITVSIFFVSQTFGAIFCAVSDPNDTDCIDGRCYLQSAFDEAKNNGEDDIIKIVQGTYQGEFCYDSNEGHSIRVEGGYDSNCLNQTLDPTNTVIDALNVEYKTALILSTKVGGDIYVEGITAQNSNKYNAAALNVFTRVTEPGQSADITIYKNICTKTPPIRCF